MHGREGLAEFERRLLLHIEQRPGRRSEWRRLQRLRRHRQLYQLYRLGLITLGVCFVLLGATAVVVIFSIILVLLLL
jgi:hypothetical protein